MRFTKRGSAAAAAGLGMALAGMSVPAEPARTALTVYSSAQPGAIPADWYRPLPGQGSPPAQNLPGYAVVRVDRDIGLERGRSVVRFTDVAALIDPTTVTFESLTDPAGTRVVEQNFQFDLVSTQKLLSRYVDRQVTVESPQGDGVSILQGTLLSAHDGLVVRGDDGQVHALSRWSGIRFGELPGGLITQPTLEWDVAAAKGGEHRARVSYQTGGITWWADYNLLFVPGADANSGFVDVGAWVSLINQSGARYEDASLKLVAGEVNRAQPAPSPYPKAQMRAMAMEADVAGFEEKAFFEYHLYTLGRPTTLPNNSTKQIELFDTARRVPARKELVYYGASGFGWGSTPLTDRDFGPASNKQVDVWLEFRNEKKSGLGVPLPAGRVRVSQQDPADGNLEFIGEDSIGHTPKDEDVRVRLGTAFDVVGERRQTDFSINTRGRVMEEAFEIRVRNHKDEAVEVLVRENLYRWSNWRILSSSLPYEKQDARTIEIPVKVAKDGEAVLTYRVRYTW
jgi:hypothetical protein